MAASVSWKRKRAPRSTWLVAEIIFFDVGLWDKGRHYRFLARWLMRPACDRLSGSDSATLLGSSSPHRNPLMPPNPIEPKNHKADGLHDLRVRKYGFLLLDNFSLIALGAAVDPLRIANMIVGRRVRVRLEDTPKFKALEISRHVARAPVTELLSVHRPACGTAVSRSVSMRPTRCLAVPRHSLRRG